ncbi:MAG: ABC transporter ATP-binding protein [Phycisphaerae bacterium]|jgi:putative ABC transport system ATP-binding protein|nr:ABC transporter ATP-binding protein [Phycisphaerae bacterium]
MPATEPGASAAASSASPAEIVVRGLRKRYRVGGRDVDALRGLDLEVRGTGFVAVMGASGSGKSTLLHLVAGLDRADGGEIEVAGQRVDRMSEAELTLYRRRTIGVVFQQFNLLPTLTALENVTLPGVLDGMDRKALEERGRSLLADLGLTERAHHRPEALSGGEQQRVAIARALLFEPRVLLADEPTGNLDSNTSERLWELLKRVVHARSILVLMVTHEPAAAAHCRTVHVLRDGLFAGSFDVDGIQSSNAASGASQGLESHVASQLALRAAELGRAPR